MKKLLASLLFCTILLTFLSACSTLFYINPPDNLTPTIPNPDNIPEVPAEGLEVPEAGYITSYNINKGV